MKKMIYAIALLAVAGIAWTGCKRAELNTVLPKPDMSRLASDFNSRPDNSTAKNFAFTVNNQKANIGKVLFYDPRLSRNNAIACASCHKQNMAFADGKSLSTGFQGQRTIKNSLHLANVGQNQHLFWNGRETDLDQMVLRPVENHIEMGMEDFNTLVAKLSQEEYYQNLFQQAFGTTTLTKEKIAACISEFVQGIRSMDSKFDKLGGFNYFANKGPGQATSLPGYTALENEGARLFFQKYDCQGCHAVPTQMTNGWSQTVADIGLDIAPTDGLKGSPGIFKTPSLRNVLLTAPYMHDGRFANLNDVLEHYSHGIKESPNLAWQFRDANTGAAKSLDISESEKQAIIAFLGTLTDATYLTDPRYSNPFVKQ